MKDTINIMKYDSGTWVWKAVILKNGYAIPNGNYSIQFPYRSTIHALDFVENEGILGAYHSGIFYSVGDMYLRENGKTFRLKEIAKTKIAEEIHKDSIIKQVGDSYIIIGDQNV